MLNRSRLSENNKFRIISVSLFIAILFSFANPNSAYAAVLTVNSNADTVADDGVCTLREAIISANTDTPSGVNVGECAPGSGADTITFNVSGTITLNPTLPAISGALTIDGAGQTVTISGGGVVQVMIVNSGAALTLNTLTITNGNCDFPCVGAGGIDNSGTLNVLSSTFTGNSSGGGTTNSGVGGGIQNKPGGTLTVTNSTFSGNQSLVTGSGGGILNSGSLSVTNSTFYNNLAASGSGISNLVGTLSVTNSTFSNNVGFGTIENYGTATLYNTIVDATSPACFGTISADASNIASDGTCDNATTSAFINLGALANNGGPTQTMALLTGSAAINAGNNTYAALLTTDQRGTGFPRINNGTVDVGAFESTVSTAVRIYWGNEGSALRSGYVGGSAANLYAGETPCGLAIDSAAGKIYWANWSGGGIRVGNLNGSGTASTLFSENNHNLCGVAIDPQNNKIYWADFNENTIRGGNLDGTGTLLTLFTEPSGSAPSGVAIDPAGGKIYWTNQFTDQVRVGSLNGTGTASTLFGSDATVPTVERNPIGVAVDPVAGKIYWTNLGTCCSGPGQVRVGSLDGTGSPSTLFDAEAGPGGLAIDPTANKIYWATFGPGVIRVGNLDGTGTASTLFSGESSSLFPALLISFAVNTTADTDDGSCDILGQGIGNQDCTLREAINAANAHSGADTITFSVSGTILLGTTLPNISDTLTIDGAGQTVTISGNNAVQVMVVNSGITLNLNALTVSNGNASNGGGIYNNLGTLTITNSTFSANSATLGGGGIENAGTLTVDNSTFSNNSAISDFSSGDPTGGGGIRSSGTLTITNSIFSGNHTGFLGGGIHNIGGGALTVTSSTFTNNSADTDGGGIWNFGTANVVNSTFSANSPDGLFQQPNFGGISSSMSVLNSTFSSSNITNNGSSATVTNSIMANSDCQRSPVTDGGGNLNYPDTACPGINVDPLLGPLQNNGGPTQTMALGAGSPAINAGNNGAAAGLTKDQRGFSRFVGNVDIGAFEVQQQAQTITFAALPDKTYGDPDFAVSATASSGLTVTFTASGNCTVTVNTVDLTGAGSCTITAHQAGNASYSPAPDLARSFTIDAAKINQTITFAALPDKTYGDLDFAISATASSGLTVTFTASGNCTVTVNTVHLTSAGSCTITAHQAGNANYNAAPDVARSFTINAAKINQTIIFAALPNKTYGDSDFAVSATASSGLTVTFTASGNCTVTVNTVHLTDAGSCTITAHQAGNSSYNPAPDVARNFTINKAPLTIIAENKSKFSGSANPTLTASYSGFVNGDIPASLDTPVTLSTTAITASPAGTYPITASGATDTNYTITFVNGTLTVIQANPKIAVDKKAPNIAVGGGAVTYTYSVTNPGNVPLSTVTVSDDKCAPVNYGSGDNGNSLLDPGETWTFACTYTPSFTSSKLTNKATAKGTYATTAYTATDSETLYPFTLKKKIYLYWDEPAFWHGNYSVPYLPTDNTPFSVEVYKDSVLVGTYTISQSSPQKLWLGNGTFTFKEVNLPSGYVAADSSFTYTTSTGSCFHISNHDHHRYDDNKSPTERTFANIITYNLAIDKIGPATTAHKGATITYTYIVTNSGPASVRPKVTDDKCGPVTYVSGDTDHDGRVDPGETWTFKCNYKVTASVGSKITNKATISDLDKLSGADLGGDTNTSNNTDTWTLTVIQ